VTQKIFYLSNIKMEQVKILPSKLKEIQNYIGALL